MKNISSVNNSNNVSDSSSKGDNSVLDSKEITGSNNKLLESLRSKSEKMRQDSSDKRAVSSELLVKSNLHLNDFNRNTDQSQSSKTISESESQLAREARGISSTKKIEANTLKEAAKSKPVDEAMELLREAKTKIREAIVEDNKSNRSEKISKEELNNSQEYSFKADESIQVSLNAKAESNAIGRESSDIDKQANRVSKKAFLTSPKSVTTSRRVFPGDPFNRPGHQVEDTTPQFIRNTIQDGGGGQVAGHPLLSAARGLLRSIMHVTINSLQSINPIVHIAKNLTNKSLAEQAVAFLEAALVDSVVNGSQTNQAIILTKAQAANISGEAQGQIAYWKQALEDNKQGNKATHDLAKGVV